MGKLTTRLQRKAERKVRREMRRESNKGLNNYNKNKNKNNRPTTTTIKYKAPSVLTPEQRQKRRQFILGGTIVMGTWITVVAVLSVIF